MLKVTDEAAALLLEAQGDEQAGDMTFRLVEKRGGFGLAFDAPHSDDVIFTCEGRHVLCVSPTIAEDASDILIEVEETREGRSLTFSVGR